MAWNLDGRVALITGGASGIGAELARQLAGRGMRLGLIDVNQAPLEAVAAAHPRDRDRGRRRARRGGAHGRDRRPRAAPRRHRRRGRQRRHRDRRTAADGRAGDGRGDDRRQPARRLAHGPRGAAARARAPRPPAAHLLRGGRPARRRARRLQRVQGGRRGARALAAGGAQAARRDGRDRLLPVPRDADGRGRRSLAGLRERQVQAALADRAHVAAGAGDRAHGDVDREALARDRPPALPARADGASRACSTTR